MKKRQLVTLASAVFILGFTGGAAAQPADVQYNGGNGGNNGGGVAGGGGGPTATSGDSLPFTGLELGLVALGGAGLAATGVVLRRTARAKTR